MRKLVIAAAAVTAVAVGVLVGALAASGGSSVSSASEQEIRRNADLWEIDQLQRGFHRATTRKNIDLMMTLYAPDATFTFPGTIAAGKKEIREFWLTSRSIDEQLGLRDAHLQGAHHRQRRPGDALLRVRLRRSEDGEGRLGDGSRRRRREDQRTLADHEPGGSVRDAQSLRRCPG